MINKPLTLAICLLSLFLAKTMAQQLSDPAKEEVVKLSGDYYWEEATAKTEDEARSLSQEFLLKKILQDYRLKENINQIKSVQVDGIEYLLYIRGPKYRMIAFIEKKNVTEFLDTLKEMHSIEVIHSDKYPVDIQDDTKKNQIDTNLNIEINNQPIGEATLDITLSQEEEDIRSDSLSEQKNKSINNQELTYSNLSEAGQGSTKDEIRKELSKINDANEMSKLVNKYKLNGKLVFGIKEVFKNPETCDIVIINPETKEVQAYLLQKNNKYINYNSNEIVTDFSNKFYGMTAIWIQYFEN